MYICHKQIIYMENEKIIIRAIEPEDLEFLYSWENDMKLWEISNTLTPYSRYSIKKYIENSHKDIYTTKQLRLMIIEKESHRPIGTIELYDFDPFHERAGLGIMIHSEEDRNKGYASAAVKLMLFYCFDTLSLHQVYSSIPSENKESIALFETLGFSKTGYREHWLKRKGGWDDVIYYQMLNPLES